MQSINDIYRSTWIFSIIGISFLSNISSFSKYFDHTELETFFFNTPDANCFVYITFWIRRRMPSCNSVTLHLLGGFMRWGVFSGWWAASLKHFYSHRTITGGTPFPLCPIGCGSNCPLGKRRLGEQPYCFSSSVITCKHILLTAQVLLRKVQADASRMGWYHVSCELTLIPSSNLIHTWSLLTSIF